MAPVPSSPRRQPRSPYQTRSVRFLRRVLEGEWVTKLYEVAPSGQGARAEVIQAALAVAQRVLPAPAVGPGRYGVGFVIAHDAPRLCYALICWWAEENEIHQQVFSAPVDHPEQLAPHSSDAVGCVWELSITDFERRAWITHVLSDPNGPDIESYLTQEYRDEV